MARKAREFQIDLKVAYVPIPADRVGAWRASLLLLLKLLREERVIFQAEVANEAVDIDRDGHDGGGLAALFSLDDVASRKKVAKTRSIYAWFIGHDGSAYRMAMGSQ